MIVCQEDIDVARRRGTCNLIGCTLVYNLLLTYLCFAIFFQPIGSRVQSTPKPPPEYDVEYEEYSSVYASPPKRGQAILGYRSMSPNKPPYPGYDVVDSAGSYESPMYKDSKHFGGRPDVRDGAEADAVKSRLNFSGGDSGERREATSYQSKTEQSPTALSRYGNDNSLTNSGSPYQPSVPAPYDPMQYQDKVSMLVDPPVI